MFIQLFIPINQPEICWSLLVPAPEIWLLFFLKSMSSHTALWKYLYHENWQMLQIKIFLLNFLILVPSTPLDLIQKFDAHSSISSCQVFHCIFCFQWNEMLLLTLQRCGGESLHQDIEPGAIPESEPGRVSSGSVHSVMQVISVPLLSTVVDLYWLCMFYPLGNLMLVRILYHLIIGQFYRQ